MRHALRCAALLLPLLLPAVVPQDAGSAARSPARSAAGRRITLALSGWMDGQLEPCGCASAQSGGLDRRAWWLKAHRGEYDLALEGGLLVHARNPLEELRFETALTVLGAYLEYPVIPLGPKDLSLGMELLRDFHEAFGPPFLVSDLRRGTGKAAEIPFDKPYRIVRAGGLSLCILSLAGPEGRPQGKGWRVLPPEQAIAEALAAAGARGRAYDLALAFVNFGGAAAPRRIAKEVPGLDLVVAVQGSQELREKAETYPKRGLPDRTHVVFPGWHGKALLLVTLVERGRGFDVARLRHAELPAFRPEKPNQAPKGADPSVFQVLLDHKKRVTEGKILEALAGREEPPGGARYVGSKACARCHPKAFEIWQKSLHAQAWHSLEERSRIEGWQATRHPSCVGCHSVGYGERSGFAGERATPQLTAVGCESCHGPGSVHVAAMAKLPAAAPRAAIQKALARGRTPLPAKTACYRCHTFAQSPGFNFHERWPKIAHDRR